jgi:uncharacterized protein YndB with AHSA1/START domain
MSKIETVENIERGPDRIEKRISIHAPRTKVWKALADSQQFGAWFGCALNGPFVAGELITGKITNPPGYEHLPMELWVERIEPERLFSFRWRPYAIEPGVDYSKEPRTLVEFVLEEQAGGKDTLLTISESGFDGIPEHRRAEAFRMNSGGWSIQAERIAKHVDT